MMLSLQALGSSKGTPLKDVADVTMEVSAGTPGHAEAVQNQLAALINGKSYLDVSSQPFTPPNCSLGEQARAIPPSCYDSWLV